MRRTVTAFVGFLALAFVPALRAEEEKKAEEPPARHENKVSPDAKALLDKLEKATYRPVGVGLKKLSGTLEMTMDLGTAAGGGDGGGVPTSMRATYAVTFEAPETITVEAKEMPEHMRMMGGSRMREGVQQIVRSAVGLLTPTAESEYDAEVRTKEGKDLLVLTMYEKAKKSTTVECELDERGVVVRTVTTPEPMEQAQTIRIDSKYAYAKEGERFRLEKITIAGVGRGGPGGAGGKMEYAFTWGSAGDLKLPVAWTFSMDTPRGGMTQAWRFTDLTVNDKKVDLPKPEKAAAPDKTDEAPPAEKENDGHGGW